MYAVVWEDRYISCQDLMDALEIASGLTGAIVVDSDGVPVFG